MYKLTFPPTHEGYAVNYNNGIELEQLTYGEYLDTYCSDEVATPSGHGLYVKEVPDIVMKHYDTGELIKGEDYEKLSSEEQDNYKYYGEELAYYDVMRWVGGGRGSNPSKLVQRYDTEEEANLHVLYDKERRRYTDDVPDFFGTKEEALQSIADGNGLSYELVQRFFAIRDLRRQRERDERKEKETRKRQVSLAVESEAASIVIDDEFRAAIATAANYGNKERQSAQVAATKALLSRNNIERIQSDFWQVFRILKQKSTA